MYPDWILGTLKGRILVLSENSRVAGIRVLNVDIIPSSRPFDGEIRQLNNPL